MHATIINIAARVAYKMLILDEIAVAASKNQTSQILYPNIDRR